MEAGNLLPLDPVYVAERLSQPPFVTVDGVLNCRDLGNYTSSKYPGRFTRPGVVYRSAEVHGMTEKGASSLPFSRARYLT